MALDLEQYEDSYGPCYVRSPEASSSRRRATQLKHSKQVTTPTTPGGTGTYTQALRDLLGGL